MLNTPNNPTGSADNRNDLAALGEVLGTHESVRILTDDIYEHLVYDGFEFMTMTGWRLGYAGGPADSIAAMGNVQQQSSTHASSITQAAALEALTGPQSILQERRDAFRRRRDLVVDALNAIEGLSCIRPDGTFFVYPSCEGLIGKRARDRLRTVATFSPLLRVLHGAVAGGLPAHRARLRETALIAPRPRGDSAHACRYRRFRI